MTLVYSLAIAALFPMAGTVPRPELRVRVRDFIERVADYVELRREVTAGVDGPVYCSDAEELTRQAAQRAAAIRDARPLASEGKIFTPRRRCTSASESLTPCGLARSTLPSRGQPDDIVLEVNAALPWGAGEPASAPLVGLLPPLPDELEYRFVGRHLVLLDVEANLVVDVLRKAVPALIETPIRLYGGCEVHPELPGCWM